MTEKPSGVGSIIGTIILVIGALWMGLSGLCTVIFTWFSFDMGRAKASDVLGLMPLVFGVGGVSIFLGWLVWRLGKYLRRTAHD